MADEDGEINRLLSEARVKSLQYARKQHKLQAAIERADAWKKYYQKKSVKTKAKKDLAMLEYWRNELASWKAFQEIRSSAARYRRTQREADLLKMRKAQAEYHQKRLTISPPKEAKRAKKRLAQLQVLIAKHSPPKPKSPQIRIVGPLLLLSGVASLSLSILYISQILAFIGLALTFWGALLLYIKPERYVKSTLLNSTTLSTLTILNQIINEHNPKGKPIYLPPKSLEEIKTGRAFISSKHRASIPPEEELATDKIILKNPDGLLLTPPGVALTNLYEDTLGTSFTRLDLTDLQNKLPKLFIEDLEIAENLEITQKSNQIHIKITGSVYKDFCQQTQKLPHICNSLGCPLCSSLAIALTRTTAKPITIEKTQPSPDGKTIQAHYQIIEQ